MRQPRHATPRADLAAIVEAQFGDVEDSGLRQQIREIVTALVEG